MSEWERLVSRLRAAFRNLSIAAASGDISVTEFTKRIHDMLEGAYAEAHAMGRWQALGIRDGVTAADRLLGRADADAQAFFLGGFAERLVGAPVGELSERYVIWRANMYASRLRGTANASFVQHSQPDARIWWVLTEAEHCRDCPVLAAQSPWTPQTLYTYPGLGDTECVMGCKCFLRREDGVEGFAFV